MKPFDAFQRLGRMAARNNTRRPRHRETNPCLTAIGDLVRVRGISVVLTSGSLPLHNEYKGDLQATGLGQIILQPSHDEIFDYVAVEEVQGTLHDLSGGFTVIHQGQVNSSRSFSRQRLFIQSGSGTGQLAGLIGGIELIERETSLLYKLTYRI